MGSKLFEKNNLGDCRRNKIDLVIGPEEEWFLVLMILT